MISPPRDSRGYFTDHRTKTMNTCRAHKIGCDRCIGLQLKWVVELVRLLMNQTQRTVRERYCQLKTANVFQNALVLGSKEKREVGGKRNRVIRGYPRIPFLIYR